VWYCSNRSGFAGAAFGLVRINVLADYDGDGGKPRSRFIAQERGIWQRSQSGFADCFRTAEDIPVPADYDGDGKTDVAVFRSFKWHLVSAALNRWICRSHF